MAMGGWVCSKGTLKGQKLSGLWSSPDAMKAVELDLSQIRGPDGLKPIVLQNLPESAIEAIS
jgi:hypothetical protein